MAHPGEPVDAELVHRVLGIPQPSEVKGVMQILLEKDLRTCSSGDFLALLAFFLDCTSGLFWRGYGSNRFQRAVVRVCWFAEFYGLVTRRGYSVRDWVGGKLKR